MYTFPMSPEIIPNEELKKNFTDWYDSLLKHLTNWFQNQGGITSTLPVAKLMYDAANIMTLPNFKTQVTINSDTLWKLIPNSIRTWYEMKQESCELLSVRNFDNSVALLFIDGRIEYWRNKQSVEFPIPFWTKVP